MRSRRVAATFLLQTVVALHATRTLAAQTADASVRTGTARMTGQAAPSSAADYVPLERLRTLPAALSTRIMLDIVQQPRHELIAEIARQARVTFVADRSIPGLQDTVTVSTGLVSAGDALRRAVKGTSIRLLVGPAGQLVVQPPAPSPRTDSSSREQERLRVSGYVRNAATREVVRRALVSVNDSVRREGNEEGFYFLSLLPGIHRLRVRAVGFVPFDTVLTLREHTALDISLTLAQVTLTAVKVQAQQGERADLDPQLPDMSVVRLDLKTARRAPVLLGEPDAIRTLTLLPGVSSASDASTAFNVRGGGADQNLILLDESTIYNPAHVLGFLSVFNSDAIDDVTLYKGAIPARFGGRLSSVVDIRQREGNGNEFVGQASIGLLSSRASFEGPMPGRRGSFMIAARRSYADMFLGLASDSAVREAVAYFYDVNAKASLRLGRNGVLLASGYAGRDRFGQGDALSTGWGNRSATLRWNQVVAGRLFSKVTTAWSDYDYRLEFPLVTDSLSWTAGIRNLDVKVDETFNITDRNRLEFGVQFTDQRFMPGTVEPRGNSRAARREVGRRLGLASAFYLGQEVELGSRVSVRYGVRYSAFDRVGQSTIYRYANNAPVRYNDTLGLFEPAVAIDSITYARGRSITNVGGFEPRFSTRFSLTGTSSIKASYARTRQYLQLATRTNSPTPLDVWEPVGPYVKPQVADQYAVGYSLTRGAIELSAEAYVKYAQNVIDFIDGADIVLNPKLETLLLQGDGRAYGLELFARRQRGRTTGWVSYTLSRAEQRMLPPASTGAPPSAGINGGRYYPSPFDKTHNLSIVAVRTLSPKWTFGGTFSLASGLPVTFPTSRYRIDGLLIADFGDRNASRLPLYHRLDVNATRMLGRGELQFGLLNAYNRFNAQSIRFRPIAANPQASEAVQLSVFGIVPSISYQFKF